jgi:uridine phosphorylase
MKIMRGNPSFKARHITATSEDLAGNNGIGRYIFLPGSLERAHDLAQSFDSLTVKKHARGHHLYLGTIKDGNRAIDVAAVSTGIGCPSMEIILHELFHLGAKRFLRVGTAGSLQQNRVKLGDLINVQASVRDEDTSSNYAPPSVPAVASIEMTQAIFQSAKKLGLEKTLHTGVVHCKSAYYAREFGAGPLAEKHQAHLNLLMQCGVLASEMETSTMFIQTALYNHQCKEEGEGPQFRVLSGAILAIISEPPDHFESNGELEDTTKHLTALAIETVKTLGENNV